METERASKRARVRHGQQKIEPDELDFLLQQYYGAFFPYKKFFQWLSYGGVNKNYFAHREFTFTLKDDVYVRYLSFANDSELRAELVRKSPHKIDIGAVYNAKPRDQKTLKPGTFQPIEKELVFDIDMTDYDEVRTCCSEANICRLCWKFMTLAIRILDSALREDFGFQNLLWVYSGRRGVHCWVCDERARKLSNEGRSAIAEYLQVLKGGDQQSRKVKFIGQLHPSIVRANGFVTRYFDDIVLRDQCLPVKDMAKVLDPIQDDGVRERLRTKWTNAPPSSTSQKRWADLEREVHEVVQKHPNHALRTCTQELMFQLTYPRLDINVSKQLNHLLKSPFCVHPKTGRVCVPIDPARADEFDPFDVPTVIDLLEERRAFDEGGGGSERAYDEDDADENDESESAATAGDAMDGGKPVGARRLAEWKKTSLRGYMELFNAFLRRLDEGHRQTRARQRDQSMAF
eukprot:Unigene6343_Nuclearia_a/m.19539 Unigene6343_Nuclearia_a/g.19539  ORF Unigene6343_Nuclearia_a/g.19539 Unigene6343_Nuclearia_a/m.19539 type:complete len:460 (-) Unigene6343_Nuclearia_a:72-1451(-)